MDHILDLGRRVELVSMDRHFHDISVALYDSGAGYVVHTYSRRQGAAGRIGFIAGAMGVLGGMAGSGDGALRFPCGAAHALASRRVFLEACTADPAAAPAAPGLGVHDRKTGHDITAQGLGRGRYRLVADGDGEAMARRLGVVAEGLVKLAGMRAVGEDGAAFDCGHDHHAVVGLLLGRALNARVALRETAEAGARGVLASPGAGAL